MTTTTENLIRKLARALARKARTRYVVENDGEIVCTNIRFRGDTVLFDTEWDEDDAD